MPKVCPTCGGTGKIPTNVAEMTDFELAKEAHRLVWEDEETKYPSNLLAILYELKGRLEDC